jgi:hypothetical protein
VSSAEDEPVVVEPPMELPVVAPVVVPVVLDPPMSLELLPPMLLEPLEP